MMVKKNRSNQNEAQYMTSLEIAQLTGKNHCDVLRAIRRMEPAWERVNLSKFALIDYKDNKGRIYQCYQLTKTETLFIATKFNDEARARLVLRWEQLEKERLTQKYKHMELTEDRYKYVHDLDGHRKLVSYLVWTEKGRQFLLSFIKA